MIWVVREIAPAPIADNPYEFSSNMFVPHILQRMTAFNTKNTKDWRTLSSVLRTWILMTALITCAGQKMSMESETALSWSELKVGGRLMNCIM